MSKIEWTDETWNPVRGCSIVSSGCANCYAMKQAHRFSGAEQPYEGLTKATKSGPVWTGEVRIIDSMLKTPFKWGKPRRVFVNSMSDLLHEDVPITFIEQILAVIEQCPQHIFQMLTKRAGRLKLMTSDRLRLCKTDTWPLPNLWLGVSVENQETANERIPLLIDAPAAVRFVSYEPALGPVDFTNLETPNGYLDALGLYVDEQLAGLADDPLAAAMLQITLPRGELTPTKPRIDWLIVGGESGPGARACDIDWIRSAVEQSTAAGVPVFVKQVGSMPCVTGRHEVLPRDQRWGEHVNGSRADKDGCPHIYKLRLRDRKGADITEWPKDLHIREFPAGAIK